MVCLCFFFSDVVRPRCPLVKDPDLDYEIDSDEEWEEVCIYHSCKAKLEATAKLM